MIEAELKARVRNAGHLLGQLGKLAEGRAEIYRDTYYDDPSGGLAARDEELRVRTVRTVHDHGSAAERSVLTYKGARVDQDSGSKPEHETRVDDPEAVHAILRGLGYVPVIAFQKNCHNYEFSSHGRSLLATVVRVPEIEGTYLEVETLVHGEPELAAALSDVRSIMVELGIREDDFTTQLYTDAVAATRTT